jgi:CBS domain-containing protein
MGHRRAAAAASVLDGGAAGDWVRPFTGRVSMHDRVPATAGPAAVSDKGRLAGVVFGSTNDLRAAREAMVRWTPDLTCAASDPLSTALERMSATGAGLVVVLDERGVVKGVLTEETVQDHLRRLY